MTFDICPYCDGTGERCFLSGAKCYDCKGTGVIEDADPDDDDDKDYDDPFGYADEPSPDTILP